MSVNLLYQTAARAAGCRHGRAATLDGAFEVSLTTPKELGGPGGNGAARPYSNATRNNIDVRLTVE